MSAQACSTPEDSIRLSGLYWCRYEQAESRPPDALEAVPDVYAANSMLEQRVQRLETQLMQAQKIADNASGSWDKFRKERDFHRLHHRRVLQEKNRLVTDIRRLKQHYSLVRCTTPNFWGVSGQQSFLMPRQAY